MTAPDYFPGFDAIKLGDDVTLWVFRCGQNTVQFAHLVPGAILPSHDHLECQFGIALEPHGFEVNLDGTKPYLTPRREVYSAGPHTPHGAMNPHAEAVVGLDVKRIVPGWPVGGRDKIVLRLAPDIHPAIGLACESVQGPWFDLSLTRIPPGAQWPEQSSEHDQVGVVLNGCLSVSVGHQQRKIQFGGIYYAPASIAHSGSNAGTETLELIQITLPTDANLPARIKAWI